MVGTLPQLRVLACDVIDDLNAWHAVLQQLPMLKVLRTKHFPGRGELDALGASLCELHVVDMPRHRCGDDTGRIFPTLPDFGKLQVLSVHVRGPLCLDAIGALTSVTSLDVSCASVSDVKPLWMSSLLRGRKDDGGGTVDHSDCSPR